MVKKKKDMSWLTDNETDNTLIVVDVNAVSLEEWDSVIAIKDLKVKWSADIKRGDVFKNIRFTDETELIESWKMVLRTEFFKKK